MLGRCVRRPADWVRGMRRRDTLTREIRSMQDKLKVLFLASDPFRDGALLRLDRELRAIGRAIRRGRARDSVELVSHFATRVSELREAVLQHQPHVVHFAAQGDAPGTICLADENGHPQPLDREALRSLFGALNHTVRVVVLNGGYTPETVEALSEVVDYSVGMNRPISDASAIHFAEAFYTALAMGRNVLAAFELAVSQLELEGNPDASIPLRRIRRGVNLDLPLVARPAEAAEGPRPPGRENGPRPPGGPGAQASQHGHRGRGFTLRIVG
ncbi:MAG TPA: CHAT domain-containing protein [Longimicrobium sp.]|nr:CHAT domain-containing protein [Longimicrobium sp.]